MPLHVLITITHSTTPHTTTSLISFPQNNSTRSPKMIYSSAAAGNCSSTASRRVQQRNVATNAAVNRRQVLQGGTLILPGALESLCVAATPAWQQQKRHSCALSAQLAQQLLIYNTSSSFLHALPICAGMLTAIAAPPADAGSSAYDFSADQYGSPVSLSKYRSQVLVVVNIASQ